MQHDLIDEDFELSIPEPGARYQPLYIRETEEGFALRLTRDPETAARYVRSEAVNGAVKAQVAWGYMLLDGHGVERDPEAALRWFRIAAHSGDADALNMVGRCYECGWAVAADPDEAIRWFRLAADKGHAWAQYNLGKLLARGHGGNRDPRVALSLLVSAARRGVPKAMNMLGRFREDGVIGAPKPQAAARWFARAAQRGCFRGQFHHARYLVAFGRVDEAEKSFRASLAQAPDKYRRDALAMLRNHPIEKIRRIALDTPPTVREPRA